MKPSRQYKKLTQRIQAPPRHQAAKLVLEFLGEMANDLGESWHGYKSIMKHTGIRRKETVRAALNYWAGKEMKSEDGFGAPKLLKTVVGWESGKGGGREGTNHYKLNRANLKALVREQGLFDPDTGKALDHRISKLGEQRGLVNSPRYDIKIGRPKGEHAGKARTSDPPCNHNNLNDPKSSLFSLLDCIERNDVLKNSSKNFSKQIDEVEDRSQPSPFWSEDGLWYRGYELEPDDAVSEDLKPVQRLQLKWKRHDRINQLFKLQEQFNAEVTKKENCKNPDELEDIDCELERLSEELRRFTI